MSEKVYGSQVPFTDYAWKDLNEIIPQGLDLGLSSYQPGSVIVYAEHFDIFRNASLNDLAALISSQAGMTLEYMKVSWNEADAGVDDYGFQMYMISDMNIGLVVNTTNAGNANSVLRALFFSDWWSNIIRYTNPDETYSAYLLNPCPVSYHYDPSIGACVHDACPVGYHWDTATQQCVIDTQTNCPIGTHWDESQARCVLDTECPAGQVWNPQQGKCVPQTNGTAFPWTTVLVVVGAVSVIGIGGYYLYKRKKRSKTRQNTPETAQNIPLSSY